MSFQHADVSSKSERKPMLTFALERVMLLSLLKDANPQRKHPQTKGTPNSLSPMLSRLPNGL